MIEMRERKLAARAAGVAAASMVMLAGCGDAPVPPQAPPSAPPSTTPARPSEEVTVRGTVLRGVETNCLVLAVGQRQYLLVHPDPVLQPGVEAVVRGTTEPGMVTTCMQGTPLVVLEAHRV